MHPVSQFSNNFRYFLAPLTGERFRLQRQRKVGQGGLPGLCRLLEKEAGLPSDFKSSADHPNLSAADRLPAKS